MSNRALQVVALVLELSSAVFMVMGVLTPDTVRGAGLQFAKWLNGESRSSIIESARISVVGPPKRDTWLEHVGYQCGIHFAAQMLTFFLGVFLVWLVFLIASVCGFIFHNRIEIPGIAASTSSRLIWWGSATGILIVTSSYIAFLSDQFSHKPGARDKRVAALLRPFGCLAVVLRPFVKPTVWIVSIFTLYLPQQWFRCLKVVHRQGVNWLLTLIGFAMFLVSVALQAFTLFRSE